MKFITAQSRWQTIPVGCCEHLLACSLAEGVAMAELDRTVWTAPVRNLGWVAARYGLR